MQVNVLRATRLIWHCYLRGLQRRYFWFRYLASSVQQSGDMRECVQHLSREILVPAAPRRGEKRLQ